MIGSRYWATGITVRYMEGPRWGASLDFYDDGFMNDSPGGISTQGTFGTRYLVQTTDVPDPLPAVLDALIADAARLGIEFRDALDAPPMLYVAGDGGVASDGEAAGEGLPDNWRQLLQEQADRLGWRTYGQQRSAVTTTRPPERTTTP